MSVYICYKEQRHHIWIQRFQALILPRNREIPAPWRTQCYAIANVCNNLAWYVSCNLSQQNTFILTLQSAFASHLQFRWPVYGPSYCCGQVSAIVCPANALVFPSDSFTLPWLIKPPVERPLKFSFQGLLKGCQSAAFTILFLAAVATA